MEEPHSSSRGTRGLVPLGVAVCLAVALAVAAYPRQAAADTEPTGEFVFQSGFEQGTYWWRGVRATLVRVRAGHDSAFALHVRPRRKTRSIATARTDLPRTVSGGVYSAGASVRGRRAGRVCLVVRELAAGRRVGGARDCRRAGGRWRRLAFGAYEARGDGHRLEFSLVRRVTAGAARRRARVRGFSVDRVSLHCRTDSGAPCTPTAGGSEPPPTEESPPPEPPPVDDEEEGGGELLSPGEDGDWRIRGVQVYGSVSYWERSVRGAPLDAESDRFVTYWNNLSSNRGISLVGAGSNGNPDAYSFATCYGTATSPEWTLQGGNPSGTFTARCEPNSADGRLLAAPGDAELTFFDLHNERQIRITGSCNQTTRVCSEVRNWRDWSSSGAAAGLDRQYNPSCSLCRGHRGLDTTTFGFRYEEAAAGLIPHLVKMTLPSEANSSEHVFPYVAGEDKSGIIPEGMRLRLRESAYDRLRRTAPFSTNTAARAMLDSLYEYGSITSDSGGSGINMKLENGNGFNWSRLGINRDSLAGIRITDFEFVQRGWGTPSP
jgi:hypothetical protein